MATVDNVNMIALATHLAVRFGLNEAEVLAELTLAITEEQKEYVTPSAGRVVSRVPQAPERPSRRVNYTEFGGDLTEDEQLAAAIMESTMLENVNKERAKLGRPPVQPAAK